MMNYDLQNELVAWLPLDRGVHKPLRPIDVPEQQLPPQLFTDDLIYSFRVKLFQNKQKYLIDGLLHWPLKQLEE